MIVKMDRAFIMEKVNNMLKNCDLDMQFEPLVHIFFILYANWYNLSGQELNETIDKYAKNIKKSIFVNTKEGNIQLNKKEGLIIIDSSLQSIDSETIMEAFLKNAIKLQARVVAEADENEVAFIEYNELDNLYDRANPQISTLLDMVRQTVGTEDDRIYEAIHKQEDCDGEMLYYLIYIFRIFNQLKENNDIVTPEIFKKIYGYCIAYMHNRKDKRFKYRNNETKY